MSRGPSGRRWTRANGCLCDRFVDSSIAYQGGAGGLGFEAVRALHRFGSHGFLPDRTLLLDLPEGEAERRAKGRDVEGADLIGGRGADYHRGVAEAFRALAEAEPERYRVIDASGTAGGGHGAPARRARGSAVTPLHGHDAADRRLPRRARPGPAPPCLAARRARGRRQGLVRRQGRLAHARRGRGPPVDGAGLDVPDDHPTARLVAAGSHPDLMRLERLTKESGTELARSISVDQVRGLQRLFATTASMSPRRAVVIDAIDDLERNAANALLKNLEEPPPEHALPAGQPFARAAAADDPLALPAAAALAAGR